MAKALLNPMKLNFNPCSEISKSFFLFVTLLFFVTASHGQKADSSIYDSGQTIDSLDKLPPAYIGGDFARREFLMRAIHYPLNAISNAIEGTIYIGIQIDSTGKIIDAEIKKGVFKDLDYEALRVVLAMPDWIPAKYKSKNISDTIVMPIKFTLTGGPISDPKHYPIVKSTKLSFDVALGYFSKKNFEKAIIYFTECIETDIQITDAYYNRGVCYKKLNKMNEACEDWKKAEKLGDGGAKDLVAKYCQE